MTLTQHRKYQSGYFTSILLNNEVFAALACKIKPFLLLMDNS